MQRVYMIFIYFYFKGEKGNKLFNLDYWEFE